MFLFLTISWHRRWFFCFSVANEWKIFSQKTFSFCTSKAKVGTHLSAFLNWTWTNFKTSYMYPAEFPCFFGNRQNYTRSKWYDTYFFMFCPLYVSNERKIELHLHIIAKWSWKYSNIWKQESTKIKTTFVCYDAV